MIAEKLTFLAARKTSGDPSWPAAPAQHSLLERSPSKEHHEKAKFQICTRFWDTEGFCRTDSRLCYPDFTWDFPEQPFQALYNHLHHLLWHYLFIMLFKHLKIRDMLMLSLLEAPKRIKGNGNQLAWLLPYLHLLWKPSDHSQVWTHLPASKTQHVWKMVNLHKSGFYSYINYLRH